MQRKSIRNIAVFIGFIMTLLCVNSCFLEFQNTATSQWTDRTKDIRLTIKNVGAVPAGIMSVRFECDAGGQQILKEVVPIIQNLGINQEMNVDVTFQDKVTPGNCLTNVTECKFRIGYLTKDPLGEYPKNTTGSIKINYQPTPHSSVNQNAIVKVTSEDVAWNRKNIKVFYRFEDASLCGGATQALIGIDTSQLEYPELFTSSKVLVNLHEPTYPPLAQCGSWFPSEQQENEWIRTLHAINIPLEYKGMRPLTVDQSRPLSIKMTCSNNSTPLNNDGFSALMPLRWAVNPGSPDLDGDRDRLLDEAEDFYARKFAPQVRLSELERHFPSSVEWYLDRVGMRFSHNAPCTRDCNIRSPGLNQDNISQETHRGRRLATSCLFDDGDYYGSGQPSGDTFYLAFPYEEFSIMSLTGVANRANDNIRNAWPVYVHVRNKGLGNIKDDYAIQYWFFYPFNGTYWVRDGVLFNTGLNHEGDWEHVTLTLDYMCNLKEMYFSQHKGGASYKINETPSVVTYTDEDSKFHPIIYSALGTHASYPTPGSVDVPNVPIVEFTDRPGVNGKRWDTWEYLINIGETHWPLNGQRFTLYGGRWGRIGLLDVIHEEFTSGPIGPAFKECFNQDQEKVWPQ